MSLGPLYVLLGEVSVQVLRPFFNCFFCLPGVELCEFFLYFGDQTVVQGIVCKYIFPYGWFPFHFADVFIRLFVFLEWSRVSSLYILEIRPLSEVSLANMFSNTVGSLCNLVLFSLAMQKLFILMRSHLFILFFMSLALGDMSVMMLLHGMSEIFLPMFSCRTFIVLRLIFKFFIHLEFIFVYACLKLFDGFQ